MSSLADLPDLVGFFSYSREDDGDSHGALSGLRSRIQGELRGQLGRTAKTFRLWQDKEAIPSGTLWETEIKGAIAQAVFFIPIITPTVAASPYCRIELNAFLAREAALGRSDLVFPILYIDVPALHDDRRQNDAFLSLIAKRQYVDWREFRYLDHNSTEVKRAVGLFCTHIRDALHRPWVSPEDRTAQEKATALQRAEEDRRRQEAEARRQEEDARKRAAAMREHERTEEERQQREAERKPAEETKPSREQADDEKTAQEPRLPYPPKLPPAHAAARRAGVLGSLIGVAIIAAAGVWLALPSPHCCAPPPAPMPGAIAPSTGAPSPVALSQSRERALTAMEVFKECEDCPEMIVVPAGSFMMGSPESEPGHEADEGPQQRIVFGRTLAVGRFAVSFDEWDACVAQGGCNAFRPGDYGWSGGKHPVINVSWNDAQAYVQWLSHKIGAPYRLLSEAEREYVTRACTSAACPATPFWFGADISPERANYDWRYSYNGSPKAQPPRRTLPVDSFAVNPWGLYQVHGNVREWTQDCWNADLSDIARDGAARMTGDCTSHVLRGGAWADEPKDLRSGMRSWELAGERRAEIGFRVARTLRN